MKTMISSIRHTNNLMRLYCRTETGSGSLLHIANDQAGKTIRPHKTCARFKLQPLAILFTRNERPTSAGPRAVRSSSALHRHCAAKFRNKVIR